MLNRFLLTITALLVIFSWTHVLGQQPTTMKTKTIAYKDLNSLAKEAGSGVHELIKVKASDLPFKVIDGKKTISYKDIQDFTSKGKKGDPPSSERTYCTGPKSICCPCDGSTLCIVEIPQECSVACGVDQIVISCPTCPDYIVECSVN